MNRRLLFIIALVVLFAIVVMVWFFMYAKPIISPDINKTKNPLGTQEPSKRFQFFNWGDTEESTSTTEVTSLTPQALLEIWKQPATGQRFITISTLEERVGTTTQGTTTIQVKKMVQATSTVLLFVDRSTGYVYGHHIPTAKTYQITNTIIPGVYDAYIFNNGKRIILRSYDESKKEITTIMATIPSVSMDSVALPLLETTYLPSNVTSVAVNKNENLVSYLVVTDAGSSVYTITASGASLVSRSPFREWKLSYGGDILYATTKPSAYVEGQTVTLPYYSYMIGNKTGLSSNPGEDGLLLNSMWSDSGLVTFLSSFSSQVILPIKTLSQKCSWGMKGFLVCAVPKTLPKESEGLPDDWFQGTASFDDSLVIIDEKTGDPYSLYSFDEEKKRFDVTNLEVSKENNLISFTRKQNGSLWLLNTNFITNDTSGE